MLKHGNVNGTSVKNSQRKPQFIDHYKATFLLKTFYDYGGGDCCRACSLLSIYTGSRLRRTPGYNEQYFSQKGKLGIDINGEKCSVATSTVYNEQIIMR